MAYDDLNDHPFAQHMASEAAQLEDSEWERDGGWADQAAALLGVPDLDGDGAVEVYCIDYAFDAFRAGRSPEEYAESVRAQLARPALLFLDTPRLQRWADSLVKLIAAEPEGSEKLPPARRSLAEMRVELGRRRAKGEG